ncbi:MAG TPA: hypothetical protein VK437_05950 [Steroidobacteraceae bacterium]|nr:hypothetical protein [Steroidobacteraceae bacterium]
MRAAKEDTGRGRRSAGVAASLAIATWAALSALTARGAAPPSIENLTGLPTYPNLTSAAMDGVYRVEALGRWCARFTGSTADSLAIVRAWYRKRLRQPSETDLGRDEQFKVYPNLTGVKLAVGVDYVAVYRLANQSTVIELHRCGRVP